MTADILRKAKALEDTIRPFVEYGKILAGQRVADEYVVVDLFDCQLTVAHFRNLAALSEGEAPAKAEGDPS